MENDRTVNSFDEAIRYYHNARESLGRCKTVEDVYPDIKPVREAFGAAWLAIDTAIKAALEREGVPRKQIPRSWDALRAMAVRRLATRNGKLVTLLSATYEMIHLGGYYYGDLRTRPVAKEAMGFAKRVIEKLSGRKIG